MTDLVSVKTTGEFMLVDPHSGTEIEEHEFVLVPQSSWVAHQLELEQLEVEPEAAPTPAPKPVAKDK